MPIAIPPRLAAYRHRLDDFGFAATIADAARPDCPIIWANDRFFALVGYPPDEVIGRNCRFLQPPGACAHARAAVRAALAAGTSTDVLLPNLRGDGRIFVNHLLIRPLAPASGLVIGAQYDASANVALYTGSDGPTYRLLIDPPDIAGRIQAHRSGVLARWVRLLNASAAVAG